MIATRPHWWPAYLGLGSNLDAPLEQIEAAISELAQLPETVLTARSACYRSAPLGPRDQADFVNAAVALLTRIPAASLLKKMLAIEARHGRVRGGQRWGPRSLDLDLLV
jgi:2-amino-4-hydroxy-6-hydroxymethyldihydropteridine diphosphokinase